MAKNDRLQYSVALDKWNALHDAEQYSEDSRYGKLAVLFSQEPGEDTGDVGIMPVDQIEIFEQEARGIVQCQQQHGRKTRLYTSLNLTTLGDALHDRSISDVVLIGHSDLSAMFVDRQLTNKPNKATMDWFDVSQLTNHLKLGTVTLRGCGFARRKLSVPFGLFAVSDHRNMLAPVGRYFSPEMAGDSHEASIVPVSSKVMMSYEDVVERFPRQTRTRKETELLVLRSLELISRANLQDGVPKQ